MKTIIIGADELILWMRKNERATGIANNVLGGAIAQIVRKMGKTPIEYNETVEWGTENKEKVNATQLPQTAAQYELTPKELIDLYDELLRKYS